MGILSALQSILGQSGQAVQEMRHEDVARALTWLHDHLVGGDNPVVRVYADAGGGRGQQQMAVRVLDRLFAPTTNAVPGLAYRGEQTLVQVVYQDEDANTVRNLRELMLWEQDQNDGRYHEGNVSLVRWSDRADLAPAQVGLTGACDRSANLADALRVEHVLRLQPFMYHYADAYQARGQQTVILEDLPELGGESFRQRGLRLELPPADFDWDPFLHVDDPDRARRARVLQWLFTHLDDPERGFDVLTTYGIHTNSVGVNAINAEPLDQVTQLVAGVLATQRTPTGQTQTARPAVIVNLDRFTVDDGTGATEQDPFLPVKNCLVGDLSVQEKRRVGVLQNPPSQLQSATLKVRAARESYFRTARAEHRVRFLSEPDADQVTAAIHDWLLTAGPHDIPSAQKVLWVQLGPVAPQVFAYAFSASTLPSLFEGANTANLAINFGRMYLRTARPRVTDVLYPTRLLQKDPSDPILRELQDSANVVGELLSDWPTNRKFDQVPAEVFARPIRAYRSEPATGAYHAYFSQLAAFYNDPANDKLSLGLAYLVQRIRAAGQQVLALPSTAVDQAPARRGRALDQPPADDPLADLYTRLEGALKDEVLELLPQALPPHWQVSRLLDKTFPKATLLQLDRATVAREPDTGEPLTSITVTGVAGWFGEECDVSLEFTAPDGAVQTCVTFGWDGTGHVPGLDWISMSGPTLTLQAAETGALTGGGFAADVTISDLTAALSWRYPPTADGWLISATFGEEASRPSAQSLFAFAAGIDLSRLPAPLNALAQLQLASIEITYDPAEGRTEAMKFAIATPPDESVPLWGRIAVHTITIDTTITEPTGARTVSSQIGAKFDLGDPAGEHAVIAVGATIPKPVFTGALESGTIGLADLVTAFLPADMTLPTFKDQPTLTDFSFSYDSAQEDLAVSVALGTTIAPAVGSVTPLRIDAVGLAVEQGRDAVDARFYGALTVLPDSTSPLNLMVTSHYTTATGWTFQAEQQGTPLKVGLLLKEYLGWDVQQDLAIEGLFLSIAEKDGSWLFTGKTPKDDPFRIPFLDLAVGGSVRVGYNGSHSLAAVHPAVRGSTVALELAEQEGGTHFGRVEADVCWLGIELTAYYEWGKDTSTFGLRWDSLQGVVTAPTKDCPDWIARLSFVEGTTLGSLVEDMVSWATGAAFALEAPWSVLNDVSLGDVAFVYTFNPKDATRNHVAFEVSIGPIELGFARIDGISVKYQKPVKPDDPRVAVTLTGSFPWNIGSEAQGDSGSLGPWDASKPGDAPAPPGQGGKYLDLRFLALGQHVTVDGLRDAETIKAALDAMKELPPPKKDGVPAVQFDPNSDWLVGMDFGVLRQDPKSDDAESGEVLEGVVLPAGATSGDLVRADPPGEPGPTYFISLQAVFNDPYLYGLRVALDGEAAKVLKGLEFEILYRQLTDELGVYQAEITLPDVMRKFDVGAYSVTLPIIAVAYYTNGDFLIDIGFPKNQDFSRSFKVEGIIAPGIPVLGAGGFYFGKLPEAATKQVPSNPARGTFNPIIVFGFGLQVGFGKSVEYGVLKAGFSLTVFGIIEGIVAKWNPYRQQQLTAGARDDSSQLQGSYYFWLQGTVGIQGKLYGSVDFAIIKAQVDVEISLYVQLTYESFVSIALSVVASVRVSASVKIDLWLFSVTLHFSFSLNLKETFTIENRGVAPWAIEGGDPAGLLAGTADRRLRAARPAWANTPTVAAELDWDRLAAAEGDARALSGYLMTALSSAADEWDAADQSQQQPVYVAMLALDSVPPAALDTHTSALKAAGAAPDTSFEKLCKRVLAWVVAASQHGLSPDRRLSYDEVLGLSVSDEFLAELLESVLQSTPAKPTPIPLDRIEAFLASQFTLSMRVAPASKESQSDAVAFPIPPGLRLTLPAREGQAQCQYQFGDYNRVDAQTLRRLRADFDALLVKVESESGQRPQQASSEPAGDALSMAGWVFADIFLLIARQMAQAARSGLRTFTYSLADGARVDQVIGWVSAHHGPAVTAGDILGANPTHLLAAGGTVTIGVTQAVAQDDSFTALASAVAARTGQATIGAADLAASNAAGAVLKPGNTIHYPGQPDGFVVPAGGTLLDAGRHLEVSLSDLLAHGRLSGGPTDTELPGLIGAAGLLDPDAELLVPLVTRRTLPQDTFATLGGDDGVATATANAGRAVLRPGVVVSCTGHPDHEVLAGECLGDVATAAQMSLTTLLSTGTIAGQSLPRAPGLIAPLSVVALPVHQVQTSQGDTGRSVAEAAGTTIEVLGLQPANAALCFDAAHDPYLTLAHLGELALGALIEEAQRSLSLQHLSGITSRYQMHGLRIPTEGITPKAAGMWVRTDEKGDLQLPPVAGLPALTGQQFAVPSVTGDDPWTITLDLTSELPWMRFLDGQGRPTHELTIPIAADTPAATAISALSDWTRTHRLDVWSDAGAEQRLLGPAAMCERAPARYPFANSITWQAVADVTLPYSRGPADLAALRLWPLPDTLAALADPTTRAVDPRMSVAVASYDEATGATTQAPVTAYGWGAAIPFTIKRVPSVPGAPATGATYQVVGASGGDLLLLERLVAQHGADRLDPASPLIYFGFPPEATGGAAHGLQTDDPATVTAGIAQVDLSTDTRPPAALLGSLAAGATSRILNKPADLVRMLWEASITRNGGFYLYYHDGASDRGFPDRIFDDGGQAVVTLLAVFGKPADATRQNRTTNYTNVLVTGEPLTGRGATLIAEADPPPADQITVAADATTSLASLATAYFADPGDLAEANADLLLRPGVQLTVSAGTYQAPLEPLPLTEVSARFGTTTEALRAANPGANLPDTVGFPLAIRLPALTPTAGSDPQTRTLRAVADYYGTDPSALAVDNGSVAGLYADQAGGGPQQIKITGGPYVRTATVPPGAAAYLATRPAPAPVPADPADPAFAPAFLAASFTMLGYAIADTAGFQGSPLGIPAGPTMPAEESQNGDKLRVVPLPDADETWRYALTLPYAPSAKPVPTPPTVAGPYAGVGSLLQVTFEWLDHFGNRVVSVLSDPSPTDQTPLNDAALLAGYHDPVVGLGQWPGIGSGWRVRAPESLGKPAVQIALTFDRSAYDGLLEATVTAATTVRVVFTEPVSRESAQSPSNYTLLDEAGRAVPVRQASLDKVGTTVELTVEQIANGQTLVLSVEGIAPEANTTDTRRFAGRATLAWPDDPARRTSTVQQTATRDLHSLARVLSQLQDPLGTSLSVTSTLLVDDSGYPVPQRLTDERVGSLLEWLTTIARLLKARSTFDPTGPAPDASHEIDIALDPQSINPAEIFELSLELTIERTGGVVLADLATTAGVRSATTPIAPAQLPPAGGGALSLTTFAQEFQDTLSRPHEQLLKIATGIDRESVTAGESGATLWCVRVGQKEGVPISYRLTDDTAARTVFAPRPASTTLQSRSAVDIYDYTIGEGLSPKPSRQLDFAQIDLDVWYRQLFAAIDSVLTARCTVPMLILGATNIPDLGRRDWLEPIQQVKRRLANAIRTWMVPVFADQSGNADAQPAQAAFGQALLSQLSNAYTTRAAVGMTAAVSADVTDPEADVPPRLFGDVTLAPPAPTSTGTSPQTDDLASSLTFSSPKLSLSTGAQPFAFLVTGPEMVRDAAGAVLSRIDLDLNWRSSVIEHQIGHALGTGDYRPSSWLSFVITTDVDVLHAHLGELALPLPLRAFPTSPTLTVQSSVKAPPTLAASGATDLHALSRWDFAFTYTLPYHYPQDAVQANVQFNMKDRLTASGAPDDEFARLAQFVTVFPKVDRDLRGALTRIDAATDPDKDKEVLLAAAYAVDAFTQLIKKIADALEGAATRASEVNTGRLGQPDLTYSFAMTEGAAGDLLPHGRSIPDHALVVELRGQPPAGIGEPSITIDGFDTEVLDREADDPFRFAFRSETGEDHPYLPAAQGLAIGPRTVVLPRMDVLQRQDALASAEIERNRYLVGQRESAAPFIYTSGEISFPNALRPSLDSSQPVDIATVGADGPANRSLHEHLGALFEALVFDGPDPKTDELCVQAELTYSYPLNASLAADPVILPVFLQPPETVNLVVKQGARSLDAMLARWDAALTGWFDRTQPLTGGRIGLDLTIMTTRSSSTMPLLRLRHLFLPVEYVEPPLSLRSTPGNLTGATTTSRPVGT